MGTETWEIPAHLNTVYSLNCLAEVASLFSREFAALKMVSQRDVAQFLLIGLSANSILPKLTAISQYALA